MRYFQPCGIQDGPFFHIHLFLNIFKYDECISLKSVLHKTSIYARLSEISTDINIILDFFISAAAGIAQSV